MKTFALVTALLCATGAAQAATVSYSDSVATTTTNWSDTILLPLFDASLGTLDSVELTLTGSVSGLAAGESLDGGPSTIVLDLKAFITASVASNPSLSVDVNPIANGTFSATAYDGAIDFGGTSGVTYADLDATDADSSVFTSGLAAFIGSGTFTMVLDALGQSTGSGPGNLVTQFNTNASAIGGVTYNYTPPAAVPLPAGLPLLLAGLGGLALLRRRKG
jgi:hypothetical protein